LVLQIEKALPGDTLSPPLPDKNQIATNEAFWSHVETQAFAPLERGHAVRPERAVQLGRMVAGYLPRAREPNQNAIMAGALIRAA